MTTNVYASNEGLLSSDSRWSCREGNWIIYVDDTDYDKIVSDDELGILFAGNMDVIDLWKTWFSNRRKLSPPQANTDLISMIIIDMKTGEVVFTPSYLLMSTIENNIVAWYGGSGDVYAKDCWQVNQCAKKAVGTAIEKDLCSGGEVMFTSRIGLNSNVKNSASFQDVMASLKEKGFIMDSIGLRVMRIKDAATDSANDHVDIDAQQLANRVMSGQVSLSAPFVGMGQPWTQEKKNELVNVLAKYAGK